MHLFVVFALAATTVVAFESYQSSIPNGGNVPGRPGLGHSNRVGGGARTSFGDAFAAAGRSWTTALCNADSDGDGFTNGQELGDPSCAWSQGGTPSRTGDLSDPGDASSTPPTAAPTTTATPTTTAAGATPPPATTSTPAPPTTTVPPPTTVAPRTLPSGSAPVRSKTAAGVGGKLSVAWALHRDPAAEDAVVDVTLGFPEAQYGAFGLADAKMSGRILVATFDGARARGVCALWDGFEWSVRGVQGRSPTAVSASTQGATATVTCRLLASDLRARAESQRAIFAVGPGISAIAAPRQHASDMKEGGRVNLYTGSVSIGLVTSARVFGGVLYFVVLIIWLIVGIVLWASDALVPRRGLAAFGVVTVVMYVLLQAMYFGVSYADNIESGTSGATARAFGSLAAFSFMWVIYPVPKHFGVAFLVGSSYERAVPYHALFAILSLLQLTAHFIAMSVSYLDVSGDAFSTDARYHHAPLFGFLAWITMIIVIIVAMAARRPAYAFFRVFHLLWIVVVVFALLHYPNMIITLAIPLVNYVVDLILRIVSYVRIGATVAAAEAYDSCSVTKVTLALKPGSPAPKAGDFALFTLGEAMVAHPFSIAWHDPATQQAELYVRSGGPGTFSGKVFDAAKSGQLVSRSAGTTGFYGALQVPPRKLHRMLLVCGGIGVTPMLSMLCAAANDEKWSVARTIRFVWLVREPELVAAVSARLLEAVAKLGSRLEVEVHVTAAKDIAELKPIGNGDDKAPGLPTTAGRPDVAALVSTAWPEEDAAVGVYACGPEALMDAVSDGVSQRGRATYYHTETFLL